MEERVEPGDAGDVSALVDRSTVSNVLVQAPSLGSGPDRICLDFLANTPPSSTGVLVVSFTRAADSWVAGWNAHVGTAPARGIVVSAGRPRAAVDDPAWSVETVANPGDFTRLGVAFTEALSDLSAAADAVAVCFDSLTALLQYADVGTVVRFLHVVAGRVSEAGGVGHYHVDPGAHQAQDLEALAGVVDAVAEIDEHGAAEFRG